MSKLVLILLSESTDTFSLIYVTPQVCYCGGVICKSHY